MTNPYDDLFAGAPGENVLIHDGQGKVLGIKRRSPPERSSTWKGARRILGCSDDAVYLFSERASGRKYYKVLGVTVVFDSRRKNCPIACLKPQCGIRGDCPHIRRLIRWRREGEE